MTLHAKFASFIRLGISLLAIITVLLFSSGFFSNKVRSQEIKTAPSDNKLSPQEIETLVGPIALYPDELLAIALPASTFPVQIVQAARFLEKQKTDKERRKNNFPSLPIIARHGRMQSIGPLWKDCFWAKVEFLHLSI